jgi:hypothetical protein
MHRLITSLGFGALLVVSVAVKMQGAASADRSMKPSAGDDIAVLLSRNGFAVRRAEPNTDPSWVYGTKGQCQVQVAEISPQGWHRSALDWHATGRVLLYSVAGKLYAQQPILRPMATDYLRRLQRYVGLDEPPVKARAVIIDDSCPADPIPLRELEALSG